MVGRGGTGLKGNREPNFLNGLGLRFSGLRFRREFFNRDCSIGLAEAYAYRVLGSLW